jgi:SUKH-3 immunity protein
MASAVDRRLARIYPGDSGELRSMPAELARRLPAESATAWPPWVCAEAAACADALRAGCRFEDLVVEAVRVTTGERLVPCATCRTWLPRAKEERVTQPVRIHLETAGWKPGRKVNVEAERLALEIGGYRVWPELLAFLEQFSGLTFRLGEPNDSVWFDAHRAARLADREALRSYEQALGGDVAPVGYAYSDHFVLMAVSDGRFIGAFDDVVEHLGADASEMLERLLGGRKLAEW